MNQIHALLITAPELVRHAFRALSGQRLVNTLTKTRPGPDGSSDPEVISRQTLKRLAVRHLTMQAEIDIIERQLDTLVRQVNPTLLSLSGVGPVTAATLLVAAGDNPERLTTRARLPLWLVWHRFLSPPVNAPDTGSPAAGTDTQTPPCTGSCSCACDTGNHAPWPTSNGAAPRDS